MQEAKNAVINMEKMLIQKKIKMDKFDNESLKKLISLLEDILKKHLEYLNILRTKPTSLTSDDENLSQYRRIIIKSLLVILNFVYSKKYLKDVIAGYSHPKALDTKPTSTDIFGSNIYVGTSVKCVMEEQATLKVFRDLFFNVVSESQSLTNQINQLKKFHGSEKSSNTAAKNKAQMTADIN